MEKHIVTAENAEKIFGWLNTRGGIAIWQSINPANPTSWTAPVNAEDGTPKAKPNWQAGDQPERIITDPAEVVVSIDKEVKRFRIAVRLGRQGMTLKLTDAATGKVKAAVAKAGDGAYYAFDYSTQEAVIYAPTQANVPLAEYVKGLK